MGTISTSGIAPGSTISATHILNITDALNGSGSTTTIIATGSFSGSFSGSFRGNLTGTSSWASNATTATTATTLATARLIGGTSFNGSANIAVALATTASLANSVAFTNISSVPAAILINGVADVQPLDYSTPNSASVLVNGTFYDTSAQYGAVSILLDTVATLGTEFTFFARNVDNPITFRTGSGADTIISENGYLSMYGTGSAVTAKLIQAGPLVWALIGSLKA